MLPPLILFTKPAIPGRVKTRLAASLGARRAAELHRAFAGDLAARLRDHPAFELRVAWALDDGAERPDWPELRGLRWTRQDGADLGARLAGALRGALDDGPSRPVAVVGSDHPELRAEVVAQAFEGLRQADVVLGPAADGGYYLLALAPHAVQRRLFEDIAWSTAEVRRQTLERAAELGLTVSQLEVGHDIDDGEDLSRLARRLADGPARRGAHCPRTAERLAAWGLLPEGARCES